MGVKCGCICVPCCHDCLELWRYWAQGLYLWRVKTQKKQKEEQDKLNFSIKSTASQIQQIKDNADFDTAIAEASGASAEALFKLRLEAARTANKLAYLNMQQVANNKEATKEQKRRIC